MNRQAVMSLESPLAGRFVNDAPEIAGNAPVKLPAVKLVSADPLSAGSVAGNLASAIVPVVILAALARLVAVVAVPVKFPLKLVADNAPVEELKVRLVPLFGGRLPVAPVVNSGKQVVSVDSSATVTLVAVVAVVAVSALPVKAPTNDVVAVILPYAVNIPTVLIPVEDDVLNEVAVIIPVVLTLPLVPTPEAGRLVKFDASPKNEVALTMPLVANNVMPVPTITLPREVPPSIPIASATLKSSKT